MKNATILIILITFFSFGFKTKNLLFINNQIVKDSIVGKYYIEKANNFLSTGLILLNEKPTKVYSVFEFDFVEDGEIKIKDLTKIYKCGNGILYFEKAYWKNLGNNKYEINLIGGNLTLSKFDSTLEYKLKNTTQGKFLELVKIHKNKK